MPPSPAVCLCCRLRLLARYSFSLSRKKALTTVSRPAQQQQRSFTGAARQWEQDGKPNYDTESDGRGVEGTSTASAPWTAHRLPPENVTVINEHENELEAEHAQGEESTGATPLQELFGNLKEQEASEVEESPSSEYMAHAARQAFGDRLPQGALNDEQLKVYERMYGPPLGVDADDQVLEDEDTRDVLYKEGEDGTLEEIGVVEAEAGDEEGSGFLSPHSEHTDVEVDADTGRLSPQDAQLQRDVALAMMAHEDPDTGLTIRSPDDFMELEEEDGLSDDYGDRISVEDGGDTRTHPFTAASRFGTTPKAVPLPRASFIDPVSHLLSKISNRHLDETAHRLFGGSSIPDSPSTPITSRTRIQKPIPLNATQGKMSEIEADVYLAAVMPQTYASVISVLVETRKRLGAPWLETILKREGGPRILDVGAGGAGVVAWREVLKAEWKRMHDVSVDANVTSSASDLKPGRDIPPAPIGKATVVTGSSALRLRASALLENTTFLPRLPDYVHASFASEDSQRKQFDVVVAPHSLWNLQEPYERRQRVQNLWNFLDPHGGVLILLEKGVPRGFEVIADARAYILGELFERKEGAAEDLNAPTEETPATDTDGLQEDPLTRRSSRRSPAQIVAPCPHTQKCPLYLIPGVSRARKDWCHFRQRYIRPPYLQRLVGAKDRNFEDVEFSYVAVQKGVTDSAPLQGQEADDRAFEGYDIEDTEVFQAPEQVPHQFGVQYVQRPPRIPNPLPRMLMQPLKRQGHIHLDMCTPAGTYSRWTVPRSYGKQAYRDARKASWGDLWALGAKQQEDRRVRLGLKHMEAGLSTGRGVESKSKVKSKAAGVVKDVTGKSTAAGRSTAQADATAEVYEGESSRRDERIRRRREAKNHGREKARSRRRSETKELFKGIET